MKRFVFQPVSALAGVAFLGLLGMAQQSAAPKAKGLRLLTPEQQEILGHMSIVFLDDGQGGVTKTIRLSGVNVQVVNGLGSTETTGGVGNLIVGYNEPNPFGDDRTGSHYLVVGRGNSYTRYGGIVASRDNTASGAYATVTGGTQNRASGDFSSVSAGRNNYASGEGASVSGGGGVPSSIEEFLGNVASGDYSSVTGGSANEAIGERSTVSGGGGVDFIEDSSGNKATGILSSVTGGSWNTATGFLASINGGFFNLSSNLHSSVCGGEANEADGRASTVSGGFNRIVSAANLSGVCDHDWVAGSLWEDD